MDYESLRAYPQRRNEERYREVAAYVLKLSTKDPQDLKTFAPNLIVSGF